MRIRLVTALCLFSASFLPGHVRAEGAEPMTGDVHSVVISGLCDLLEEIYVIPETARDLVIVLEENLAAGRYDSASTRDSFAAAVTADLQAVSGDLHLRLLSGEDLGAAPVRVVDGVGVVRSPDGPGGPVRVVDGVGVVRSPDGPGGPVRVVRRVPGSGSAGGVFDDAVGIPEAQMLAGGVGYVDIRLFVAREQGETEAAEAMAVIEDAEAIIFDLRMCRGGAPDMVHFITSYLYPPEPKLLLTYHHAHEEPKEAYTLEEIPGRRMPDVPVYILTSSMTASGGEEFSYGLKHHGRATLVGETTAGGGHGGGVHPVAAGFHAFVPDFRPVHPVTGRGWEGVGVVPDIVSTPANARRVAHELALETLISRSSDPVRRGEWQAALAELRRQSEAAESRTFLDPAAAEEYVGRYGYRAITFQEGSLYLQRDGGPKLKMVATDAPDAFVLEMLPQAKIQFQRGSGREVERLEVLAMSGKWEVAAKDSAAVPD